MRNMMCPLCHRMDKVWFTDPDVFEMMVGMFESEETVGIKCDRCNITVRGRSSKNYDIAKDSAVEKWRKLNGTQQ